MADHKDQHFIPQCYLKAWCDPDTPPKHTPYVWVFPKDGSESRKKAPENIFYEKDMYTIEEADGARNLVLEHGLHELETRFTQIRNRRLRQRESLTAEELIILCEFVAALDARTKARRDHEAKHWNQLLKQMEKLREEAKKSPAKFQRRIELPPTGPTLNYDQVKQIAAKPMQHSLVPMTKSLTSFLVQMDLAIMETDDSVGFITCDHPCIWFDPEAYKTPLADQVPALMYKSTEIRIPISPNQMLVFNQKGINGYRQVDLRFVDELNRITRFYAHEYFVVRSNVKKEIWFKDRKRGTDCW
jgi:hypothetical protein